LSKQRIYWDSCVWLGLVNRESDKIPGCIYNIERAQAGAIEILTSAFSLAEVFKTRCKDPLKSIPPEYDLTIENFFRQDYIIMASVDEKVAVEARRILLSLIPL